MKVEGQVRALVRAWPAWDRRNRGEEILTTTLAVVDPARTNLPPGLVVNLLAGGLQARWRARPPVWRWWLFHLGFRLPMRWHPWMLDTLLRRGWRRRFTLGYVFAFNAMMYAPAAITDLIYPPGNFYGVIGKNYYTAILSAFYIAFFGVVAHGAGRSRRQKLDHHGYDEMGRLNCRWVWVRRGPAVPNLRLVSIMVAAGLPSMLVAVVASFALFHQHPRPTRFPGGIIGAPPPPPWVGRSLLITGGISAGVAMLVCAAVAGAALRHRRRPASGTWVNQVAPAPVSRRATRWAGWMLGVPLAAFGTWLVPVTAVQGTSWKWTQLAVAAGSAGVVLLMGALLVHRAEHRLGRPIGAWDGLLQLGPRWSRCKLPLPSVPPAPVAPLGEAALRARRGFTPLPQFRGAAGGEDPPSVPGSSDTVRPDAALG